MLPPLLAAAFWLLLRGLEARSPLASIPNAALVPCVNNEPGCHGQSTCESFAHYECYSLAPVNEFGKLYIPDPTYQWTLDKCAADSDGDGRFNGDELGDVCCTWQYGQEHAAVVSDVADPARAASYPSLRASCSNTTSLSPPQWQAASLQWDGAAASLLMEWAVPSASSQQWSSPWVSFTDCVCQWSLVLSVRASAAAGWRNSTFTVSTSRFAACFALPPGATVVVAVAAINRGGTSAPSAPLIIQLAALNGTLPVAVAMSPSLPTTAAAIDLTCGPAAALPLFSEGYFAALAAVPGTPIVAAAGSVDLGMNTAGKTVLVMTPISSGVSFAAAVWVVVLALGVALTCGATRDPLSALRAALLHTSVWRLPPARSVAKALLWEVATASRGFVVVFLVCLLSVALAWWSAWAWFSTEIFFFSQGYPVHRAAGYALSVSLGLQLLPVARWSVWLHLLGLPFERALRLHRWMGAVTVALTLWHGIGMSAGFAASSLGWQYVVTWNPFDAINPLAGVLAGAGILLISALSLSPVRRACYEVMLAAHLLAPAVLVLVLLHVPAGGTTYWPILAPPLILLGVDAILIVADVALRPVRVVGCGVISDRPLDASWHRTAYFAAEKRGRWAWVDALWPFAYAPGQYLYVALPGLATAAAPPSASSGAWWRRVRWSRALSGLLPHPFSISSPPDPAHPGRFTVHVKSMGPGTWSDTVVTTLLSLARAAEAVAGEKKPTGASVASGARGASAGAITASAAVTVTVTPARLKTRPSVAASPFGAPRGSTIVTTVPGLRAGSVRHVVAANPLHRPSSGLGDAGSPPALDDVEGLAGGCAYAVPDMGGSLPWAAEFSQVCQHLGKSQTDAGAQGGGGAGHEVVTLPPGLAVSMYAGGPFGQSAVQLARYAHFVLVAGGIGITPVAPLLCALARGQPVDRVSAWWPAVLCAHAAARAWLAHTFSAVCCSRGGLPGRSRRRTAALSGKGGPSAAECPAPTLAAAVAAAKIAALRALREEVTARPQTIFTVWTTRDRALIDAFAPLIGAEHGQAAAGATPDATECEPTVASGGASGEVVVAANPVLEAAAAADAAAVPPATATPASPPSTPQSNPVSAGTRLAAARKWESSFSIFSRIALQPIAGGGVASCQLDLKLYLTSGRRKTTASGKPLRPTSKQEGENEPTKLLLGGADEKGGPLLDVASAAAAAVVRPAQRLSDSTRRDGSTRSSLRRFGSLLLSVAPHAGAEDLPDELAQQLAASNAAAQVLLPTVGRERPDLPRVLQEVAEELRQQRQHATATLATTSSKAQQLQRPPPAKGGPDQAAVTAALPVVRGGWLLSVLLCLWASLRELAAACVQFLGWLSCSACVCSTSLGGAPAAGVDDRGRVAVAVVVCGPQEMVLEAAEVCRQLNTSPLGHAVVFHVHHETFVL